MSKKELTSELLYRYINNIKQLKILHEEIITDICQEFINRCLREQNVVKIETQVTIVGCLNGQLQDLLNIFEMAGELPFSNYLFLGDYVNFGQYGLEIYLLLMCYKILFPTKLIMLRGQNEIKLFSEIGGFQSECFSKYGNDFVYKKIIETFRYLPIAANIQNKIFCSHGGILKGVSIDNLQSVSRVKDLSKDDLITKFIISHPKNDKYYEMFKWYDMGTENDCDFDEKDIEQFLNDLNKNIQKGEFKCVITTNYLKDIGEIVSENQKMRSIWSASDFLGEFGNLGVYMEVNGLGLIESVSYRAPPRFVFPFNYKPLTLRLPKSVPDFFA